MHLLFAFPARPPPRWFALSVPCRTSTAIVCAECSLPDLNRDHLCSVFPARSQPRDSARSVPRRTSTATICAQCSLPGLNCGSLRAVFRAGPQPRVPCWDLTAEFCAQCSLPDLNRDHLLKRAVGLLVCYLGQHALITFY